MLKKLFIFICFILLGLSILWIISQLSKDSYIEPDAPTGKARIEIDARRTGKAINPRMFGTAMSEARGGTGKRDAFSNPKLKSLFNELAPSFITIQNTSAGFPFYVEETGEYSKRMTSDEILKKMNFTSDPAGELFYQKKAKNEPSLHLPLEYNFDDILRYFESLEANPGIAIRVPTIFTTLGNPEIAKIKLNLDPQTGADLVHYLNDPATTALGKIRAQNGHPLPYGVKYYVLGNEMWNNFIHYGLSYDQIAAQHNAFARAMKAADPTIKIGFNLANDSLPHELFKPDFMRQTEKYLDFNDQVLSRIKGNFDFVTYHVYPDFGIDGEGNTTTNLTPSQWKLIMAQSYFKEKYQSSKRHRDIVQKYNPRAEVINDEYSGPLANLGGALFAADHIIYLIKNGYDAYGGYWTTGLFESFNKFGLIKIPEDFSASGYVARPSFYAIKMFTRYTGDTLVESKVDSDTFESPKSETEIFMWPSAQIPSINVLSSIRGRTLYVTAINRETNRDIETEISIKGFLPQKGKVYTLDGPSLNATNEDNPETVVMQESSLENPSEKFTHVLKKHSITVFEMIAIAP